MKKLVLIFLCQLLRRNSTYSVHWILSAPINTGGVFCWGTDLLIGVDQIHLFFSFKPVLHVELLGLNWMNIDWGRKRKSCSHMKGMHERGEDAFNSQLCHRRPSRSVLPWAFSEAFRHLTLLLFQ